jgi:diacylglycerol kinase family enzyme
MSATNAEAPTPASSSEPAGGSHASGSRPLERRLWALCALAFLLASVGLAVAIAVDRFPRGLSVLACLVVFVWAGRRALITSGRAQALAAALAVAALAGAVLLLLVEGRPVAKAVVVVLFACSVLAGRRAFRVHVRLPAASPPRRPVLFFNPKSGGGKAERFELAKEARARGIEPVELTLGSDLGELVREAVRAGADGLAMAGGDGSQAIVAAIAAEHDLPYACIPAGTRNHFALDLGVDRTDVVGALEAFRNGGERRVDLAEVNGRVFVNNVSLGVYAEAVQRDEYRGAKLRTIAATAASGEGAGSELHWRRGGGTETAAVVLVSNNPYRLARGLASGTRTRLDAGVLGVAVLGAARGEGDGAPSGSMETRGSWSERTFEVQSPGPVPAGIDGEAAMLDPPLLFRSVPGALRVRIAPAHPGASPSSILPESPIALIAALARFGFGPARPQPEPAPALPATPEPSGERPRS